MGNLYVMHLIITISRCIIVLTMILSALIIGCLMCPWVSYRVCLKKALGVHCMECSSPRCLQQAVIKKQQFHKPDICLVTR